jgi:hypothetical protein
MKRFQTRRAIIGLLIVFLVLAGAAYFVPRHQPVDVAAFYDRLAVGMTEAEVGRAVPIPPGDHTGCNAHSTEKPIYDGELPIFVGDVQWPDGTASATHPLTAQPLRGTWWRGRDGLLIVFYGDDGRVIDRRYRQGKSYSWAKYQLMQLDPRLEQLLR